MKALERVNLINDIASKLQEQMTYAQIDMFLPHFGINSQGYEPSRNSKRIYVQELLANEKEDVILKIAEELDIKHNSKLIKDDVVTFWDDGYFRLFISHLAIHKVKASQLQAALKIYGISSFVAHEDIEPSREWQIEIEKALHTMEALAAILMKDFRQSSWCDQEIGFAVGRDVLIIPIKKEIDPYGFIGKYQAIQPKNKSVAQVANDIFRVIVANEKTRNSMIGKLSNLISTSNDINQSVTQLGILSNIENIPIEILEKMIKNINENNLLLKSSKFLTKFKSLLNDYDLKFNIFKDDTPNIILDDEIPF